MKIVEIFHAWSKNERFMFFAAFLVFAVSGYLTLSLFIMDNTVLVAKSGGEFREGAVGQPIFINPVIPTTEIDRDISRLVYSSVTEVAESIKRSDDDKTYNIRLKEGVAWHDGEILTADDIIFTLDTIQNPEARSPLYASFQGVTAERVSELEVKFVLQNPYAFFEQDHLENILIIPKHIFADTPVENLRFSIYGLKPIGSGPYKASGYTNDKKGVITVFNLQRNGGYFADKPNIQKIVFKFYHDTGELTQAYNSGQIDGFGLSSAESLGQVNLRHNIYYFPSSRYYAIFINQSTSPKELKSLGVREQDEALKNTSYEMLLFGNTVKEGQDLFAFWHSLRRFYPDQNLALYQNKKVDADLEAYRKNFNELDRLKRLKNISDLIAADYPAVFLYSPDYLYVAAPKLGGIDTTKVINTATDRFADINKWYVKTKRVFK
ncbi:MAG: hypothetical protein HYR95_00635 [Candidatus Colwellbacteria bacterium]|nr:hypothetical protein [Candidatus Colwellbacteria bacterium]